MWTTKTFQAAVVLSHEWHLNVIWYFSPHDYGLVRFSSWLFGHIESKSFFFLVLIVVLWPKKKLFIQELEMELIGRIFIDFVRHISDDDEIIVWKSTQYNNNNNRQ